MAEMKRSRVSGASLTDAREADTTILEKTIRERLKYPHHRHALLEESGISLSVVAGRGYCTATTKTELAELGFSGKQRLTPALVVPMYSPAGDLVTYQIRPDAPRTNQDGKAIKYETPAGSPVRLDVHPSQTERVKDASVPLWIIEGVKKADSLASRGQCAVALQGVWCWKRDGVPLADWEDVRLHGRPVCVAFDSDVMTNPKVQAALEGLVGFLEGRGASVKVLYLPNTPGRGKQGVDDFLAANGTLKDLKSFIQDGRREDLLPTGTLLSEVEPERVRWLWPGRIPYGKLTVFDGDPGLGKSAATLDIAARLSAGIPLPDGTPCEPAGVVLLSAEDGLADTIRPRLDAAGANVERVVALSTVPDGTSGGVPVERVVSIPEDLPAVERAIRRVGAALVVIDPIMAFLSSYTNSHKDQDVRRALAPLAALAERTGAAILIVRHLNKTAGGNPLYRGGGSVGIIGAARSGLLVAKDPQDDERRVLAPQKSNLTAPPKSLTFRLQGSENGALRVAWGGVSELTAAALLSAPLEGEERDARDNAVEVLRTILEDGPVPAKSVQNEAREAGVSGRTLERAKKELGIESYREGEAGKRGGGSWYWELPVIKAASLHGWQPKSSGATEDPDKEAYLSVKSDHSLRLPTEGNGVGDVNVGNLNPVSPDITDEPSVEDYIVDNGEAIF